MRCVQRMSVTTQHYEDVCHVIVVLRVDSLDLGFHVVIGVGRLIVQQESLKTSTSFHHAYAIPSTNFLFWML